MTPRDVCRSVWQAGVDAVDPRRLVAAAARAADITDARSILVVGGGKAGAAMVRGLLDGLPPELAARCQGVVNVPGDIEETVGGVRLVPGRPAGANHPTAIGAAGTRAMLDLVAGATPDDRVVCLISGGGSALLPAPAAGLTLADKQAVTALLQSSGAPIAAMNCVRKHLSAIKGGGLVRALPPGVRLDAWLLSDVIGDPLDVIASGPTAADPSTFADAWAVVERSGLIDRLPPAVRDHLEAGVFGRVPETLKALPPTVTNCVIGSNAVALAAAERRAAELGYATLNLGAYLAGETRLLAGTVAEVARSILRDGKPLAAPCCVLLGGETTVTLPPAHGTGGRNQEFALALLLALDPAERGQVTTLSGGTDGEDGPTDCAGAFADAPTLERAAALGLDAADALARHDAYPFFRATSDLLTTGLTGTNVMDVRVVVVR